MDDVNSLNEKGVAAIHLAAAACGAKNLDIKNLLEQGAELELLSKYGRTALHYSCHNGNHHIVKLLLSLGADPNIEDAEGHTPIFMAVEGCNAAINLLVEAGADLNKVSSFNTTPISLACKIGKVGAIKNLLDLDASLDCENVSAKSLIRLVIESFKSAFPSSALQMVRMLIKSGAQVGACDVKTGQSELHLIAERAADRSYGEKYSEIMKVLINGGANPWQVDNAKVSPISMTSESAIAVMQPALKKYVRKKEVSVATKITTVLELKAFFFNQSKLSKSEVYELLPDNTPAKKHFEEALALPVFLIDGKA